MLFKVPRDWFWPDGSCQGLLGQIYTRDHKLHDSENKGKGMTKEKLRVKSLKWEKEGGDEAHSVTKLYHSCLSKTDSSKSF